MGRKLRAVSLFGGGWELCSHVAEAEAEAYLHAEFHLDPSNHLVTIHQRYKQERTERQTTVR